MKDSNVIVFSKCKCKCSVACDWTNAAYERVVSIIALLEKEASENPFKLVNRANVLLE